ncbi:hypothetical protein B4135_1690 [Caldibacillus debilis]|uniref:Uncharacterized protein n=1 Tax=Caldibacillus debilis TaxID=301148 RepID=A0A150M8X6_9BACI|nr:hypothetical protein B4135_1690 [Caldibacillus debilis]
MDFGRNECKETKGLWVQEIRAGKEGLNIFINYLININLCF